MNFLVWFISTSVSFLCAYLLILIIGDWKDPWVLIISASYLLLVQFVFFKGEDLWM